MEGRETGESDLKMGENEMEGGGKWKNEKRAVSVRNKEVSAL